jgi:hypothetical protein
MKIALSESQLKAIASEAARELSSSGTSSEYVRIGNAGFNVPALAKAFQRYAENGNADYLLSANITLNGVSGRAFARVFVKKFFKNIRDIICGAAGKAMRTTSDLTGRGMATALAAWITGTIGISSPMAIGIASLIIIALMHSSKKAFCDMTEVEAVGAMDHAPPAKRSARKVKKT